MRVETGISTNDSESGSFNKWRVGLVAFVFVSAVGAGLGFAALTPSTEIPVGVVDSAGISMTPTYGTDNLAVYADVGQIESGDVVIFRDDASTGEYIMHRVVGENEQGYVTKGGAFGATDQSMGRSYVTENTRVGEVYVVVDSKGIHVPAW